MHIRAIVAIVLALSLALGGPIVPGPDAAVLGASVENSEPDLSPAPEPSPATTTPPATTTSTTEEPSSTSTTATATASSPGLLAIVAAPPSESESESEPSIDSSSSARFAVAPSTTAVEPQIATPATSGATDSDNPNRSVIATARNTIGALVAYDEPEGNPIALPFVVPNPHQFGGPLTLMVTEGEINDEWVKVQLPIRPNGSEGWIPTADYTLTQTFVRAEVSLSSTSVRVFDDGALVAETQAAIGAPNTPTPIGTFYVAARRRNPPEESYLGEWAVVLSSFSEVLDTFSGGLPVIAIHGTNNPGGELGHSISNGCVRVPNDVMQFLAEHLPPGAPVIISP